MFLYQMSWTDSLLSVYTHIVRKLKKQEISPKELNDYEH